MFELYFVKPTVMKVNIKQHHLHFATFELLLDTNIVFTYL